ncbi:MAG: carbohydrate binding domain-containing protein [Sedimentisphaerales bacterium]|nr:carbohydrate binding domain-containing protein [Sedimentisphaerales bacterium]
MSKHVVYSVLLALLLASGLVVPGQAQTQVDNLALNGSFEEDEVILDDPAWEQWATWGYETGLASTVEIDETEFIDGARSLRVEPTGGTNWYFIVLYLPLPLEVGQDYTASLWAKAQAPRPFTAQMKATDNSVTWGAQTFQLTTEWAEYTLTAQAMNASAKLELLCAGNGSPFWLDFVLVYQGSYVAGIAPSAASPPVQATGPTPADGATDIPREVMLGWKPGQYAQTHDIYLGADFDDVNEARRTDPRNVLASEDQDPNAFDPGRLEFGQTYYWRVDEVNGPPDGTIHKGEVWSFTTEPELYPIQGVIATASIPASEMSGGPEATVDGSGLSADGRHATADASMWVGDAGGGPAWIQFDFNRLYKIYEIHVWNYNNPYESLLGFGAKDITIEYATEPNEWLTLGDVQLDRATGSASYAGQVLDLDGLAARSVRLNIHSSQGGGTSYGLSEIRFLHKPVFAREPEPADGATHVSRTVSLRWRPGREAGAHQIHLGTDSDAVASGAALVDTTTVTTYDPDSLILGTTYYWRIDEVNDAETPTVWPSDVWSFTTERYVSVETFESYTDDTGSLIYEKWLDGYEITTNGSQVGHDNPPYAEESIVHGGSQSMPLYYSNTGGASYSEAEFTLPAAQDWTAWGIKTLSLYFRGTSGNSGQLYVKIDGTRVDYDGDPADLARTVWQPWNIDLSAVAGNLANVTKLTIGIDGAGAAGLVYIDDILLSPQTPQYAIPAEPDNVSLAARYPFDGNANDSSGHGFNGTANGTPLYSASHESQAIQLDGVSEYVAVASVGIAGAAPRTITGWVKADMEDVPEWTNVFGFTGPSTDGMHFDIEAVGTTSTTTLGYYGLHRHGWERDIMPIDLEWHHLAATYDGATVSWYGDGLLVGSAPVASAGFNTPGPFHIGKRQDNTNCFSGLVDEVRVYSRALSDGEIAWLAGRTEPVHKPLE